MNNKMKLITLALFIYSLHSRGDDYDPAVVIMPTTGWGFVFVSPPLKRYEASRDGASFKYSALANRYMQISLFVEPSMNEVTSMKGCKNYYWNKAKKNALIKDDSVKFVSGGSFERVTYATNYQSEGQDVTSVNVNFYGYRDDYCIDIHMSKVITGRDDVEVSAKFIRSLDYFN